MPVLSFLVSVNVRGRSAASHRSSRRPLLIQRRELYLLRQRVRGRLIAVAPDEYTADDEHGIVWRRNLRHAFRYGSLPAGPVEKIVTGLGSRRTFADVGKVCAVRRISELHAVIPPGHIWRVQDLRPIPQVEPAADIEHVVGSGSQ